MRRRPDEDDEGESSADARAEEFFRRFLQRHPRFFVYLGIGILALIVIGLVAAKFSG